MNELLSNQGLSEYNRYILDKIIARFDARKEFNIYGLIEESVLHKCILPSQNELVMDTYYTIKEYLIIHNFVIERKEMTSYVLTSRGVELMNCGSIEKFEKSATKKNKSSLLNFLFGNKSKSNDTNKLIREYE